MNGRGPVAGLNRDMLLIFGAGLFLVDKMIARRLTTRTFYLENQVGMNGNERNLPAA